MILLVGVKAGRAAERFPAQFAAEGVALRMKPLVSFQSVSGAIGLPADATALRVLLSTGSFSSVRMC